ncbi:MAG: extensin family protein [Hyphomicrobium sp.]|nr:extensin family protein [Hyphomicrobium sp.]
MVVRHARFAVSIAALIVSGLALWGCATGGDTVFVAKDEPWRAAEERACMASGSVRQTTFLRGRSALNGPSTCGAEAPFEMSAADGGRVALRPAAMLRCPMIPQVDRWVRDVVEPAARAHLGQSVIELTVAASYACRAMNHVSGARLSEHGYANAVDISIFTLESGERITVKGGWNGTARERAFLRSVHDGACENFTTVLGPNYDSNHADHFHMDLARHGRDGLMRICK